jgi:D-aminopeptidase
MSNRRRLREFGITIGEFPAGRNNAISDVAGVCVGHATVIDDTPRIARTGVTVILPRSAESYTDHCFAGYHSFNGNGEMTGMHWLEEAGELGGPIAITNTHQVGLVRDALVEYEALSYPETLWCLPVVAETYDGWLNDINAFHLCKEHVWAALQSAAPGAVAEGNVGGGTGMICHRFKGGIGTASRLLSTKSGEFTVGALVQANYGARRHLRIGGAPVGQWLNEQVVPDGRRLTTQDGSIIVVIATDAPLLPHQCKRLARRATVGLARVGGTGYNGSGDLFLAFATGNHLPAAGPKLLTLAGLANEQIDLFFDAAAEAVEEAILNALCMAETMTGYQGRTVYALPIDEALVQRIIASQRADG